MEIPDKDRGKEIRILIQTLDTTKRGALTTLELGSISELIFVEDAIKEDVENANEIIENINFQIYTFSRKIFISKLFILKDFLGETKYF